jgi:hypothetical protein
MDRATPAQVTSWLLVRHQEQWAARLTPAEQDAFMTVRQALLRIDSEDHPEEPEDDLAPEAAP